MDSRELNVAGHKVTVAQAGEGPPLVYLHGFADVHAAAVDWLPFHAQLAQSFTVVAPAHPGCAGSDEDESIETIDDVAFRYFEILDALELPRFDLVGTCFGGWIAAELAVRNPERVNRLVLIGASGLYLAGRPIGDLFWEIQPKDGSDATGLRRLLFAQPESPEALAMFPDRRSDIALELSRYKAMRFCSRVGFSPPYFYNRKLRARLARYTRPALVLSGDADRMVPVEHAHAYREGLAGSVLALLPGCGHSPQVEQPQQTAAALRAFLA